jgi:hypothetical protein
VILLDPISFLGSYPAHFQVHDYFLPLCPKLY